MWAAERAGEHHHSHVHTATPFQAVPGLPESRGQTEVKVTPILAKPWIYGGAREDDGNKIHGLTKIMRDASRTKNGVGVELGVGDDPRSADLHPMRCELSVLEPRGFRATFVQMDQLQKPVLHKNVQVSQGKQPSIVEFHWRNMGLVQWIPFTDSW